MSNPSDESGEFVRLPPYGKVWLLNPPSAGVVVTLGPDAWPKAKAFAHECMVLPDECEPSEFRWPTNRQSALILETGPPNDARLQCMAEALIRAGAPSVVALRDSLMDSDPRVFFVLGDGDDA